MADQPKNRPLSKAEVMAMTGMSSEQFDKRTAEARAPQRDNTWNRLGPSEGGGLKDTYVRANAAQEPLQQPVGAMAGEPRPTTLVQGLETSGTSNSALNNVWRDREAKAGL